MALRQRFVNSVVLNASGAGSISFTMRGDFLLQHQRQTVTVPKTVANPTGAPVLQATGLVDINGDDFEGSYSGNNDASDTQLLMLAGEIITCTWSGGDVGATATFTVRGIEYKAGDGIKAVASAVR